MKITYSLYSSENSNTFLHISNSKLIDLWGLKMWWWLLPRCVAGVGECEVAHPQLVHGAQGPQTAVEWVTTLNPNQTGGLTHIKGLQDVCADMTVDVWYNQEKDSYELSESVSHLGYWRQTWRYQGISDTSCESRLSAPAFVWQHLCTECHRGRMLPRTEDQSKDYTMYN